MRDPQGPVSATLAERLRRRPQSRLCTSIVVTSELRYGVARRASRKLANRVEAVLSDLEVLALDEPADRHYGRLRSELEAAGTPIGPNDLFIAAQALTFDLTLVTDNVREFERVARLQVENWLR
ncbi:MAG: type II toxin-antitoxin system VapC family toxin [Gammaproteobacteria bacterium]|nr:type II toxin-antitoxin system VapC family toxin [Gammaproteobacteria bacterium]MBU1439892.1 type II toxin-antitoxin system VapC family toxin [Gammaproteobacteria bacterium]MBU2285623.1 type II toxin-antitoxin system VapC family toxin [Gammaproteobacteria bacterium]MBU2407684.1 type II toxin-antitoxin system VapC family toxin [Gammaproteobacteria bacterium]